VSAKAKATRIGAAGQAPHEAVYPATADAYAPGCTCFYLRSATRRITQVYDDELKSAGISVNQYSLLSRLSRHGGLSVSAFAEHMSMDRTTLIRNLAPLEAAGWIASGGGGRARLLSLTEAGMDKVRETFPLWLVAQARVNEQLGADLQRGLHRLLKDSIHSFGSTHDSTVAPPLPAARAPKASSQRRRAKATA